MPHMESVSIGVWIGVGSRHEEKRLCGMGHLIEHMLFKGTISRTANMLKEAIEGVGGSFNGFTSEEVTCYLVKMPSSYVKLGVDVLSDMVLNPKVDPVELEKEKYVICEEIKMYMDQPSHIAFDILSATMWPNHPLGRPIAGYINTVKNFKRDDLVNFKNKYYQPANISIVATGKVKHSKVLEFAENIFRAPGTRKSFPYKLVREIHKGAHLKPFYKDTKQTHIAFGFHSIKRSHKMKYALALLNIILGGNMSSRLFERLREQKPLCYDISSSVRKHKETGAFIIHAGVSNNKLLEASREIVHELNDIKKNLVSPDELHRAKEYSRGQFLLALEDTASRMLWLGDRMTSLGKAPSVYEIFKNIDKVTAEDIKKLANHIFDKKNMNFSTVGPAGAGIRKKLRKALVL